MMTKFSSFRLLLINNYASLFFIYILTLEVNMRATPCLFCTKVVIDSAMHPYSHADHLLIIPSYSL